MDSQLQKAEKVCSSGAQPRSAGKRKISDQSPTGKKARLHSQKTAKNHAAPKSTKRAWSAAHDQKRASKKARKSRKYRSLPARLGSPHTTHVHCRAAPLDISMFEIGKCLGTGGFGAVYEAIRKSDQRKVALKLVKKTGIHHFIEMHDGQSVPEEVYYHSKVKHPAIIELLGHFWYDDYFVMVMEKPDEPCDLADYLNEYGVLNEDEGREIFRQVLEAAIHCEERKVFHRDIKTENIILDVADDEVVKLTDFGLSSMMQEGPYKKFRGTTQFCPPEFFACREYHATPATVWQLGCLVVDMLSWCLPYENPRDALSQPPSIPDNVSNEAKDLIRSMLARDPDARPNLQEIRQHPWLNESALLQGAIF